jgi:hypothetical protein
MVDLWFADSATGGGELHLLHLAKIVSEIDR